MLTPFQVATSSSTRVVESLTSETWPPMIPASPVGPVAVADQHRVGVEAALDPVEGGHPLALARGADDDLAARDPVEVERVQRLGGHQHHVVGDVDDVVPDLNDRFRHGRAVPRRATGANTLRAFGPDGRMTRVATPSARRLAA